MKRNPNKYNARASEGYGSQDEREYGDVLELLKRAGQIKDYVHHGPAVVLSELPRITWAIDYRVVAIDGSIFYVEYKGMATDMYKMKLRLYKEQAAAGNITTPLFVVTKYGPMRFRVIESVNAGTLSQPV